VWQFNFCPVANLLTNAMPHIPIREGFLSCVDGRVEESMNSVKDCSVKGSWDYWSGVPCGSVTKEGVVPDGPNWTS